MNLILSDRLNWACEAVKAYPERLIRVDMTLYETQNWLGKSVAMARDTSGIAEVVGVFGWQRVVLKTHIPAEHLHPWGAPGLRRAVFLTTPPAGAAGLWLTSDMLKRLAYLDKIKLALSRQPDDPRQRSINLKETLCHLRQILRVTAGTPSSGPRPSNVTCTAMART